MTEVQKLIASLISDYEAQIKHKEDNVKKWSDTADEYRTTIKSLKLAIEQVKDIPDAVDVLRAKMVDAQRYLTDVATEYAKSAKAELDAIKAAKRPFMKVIQGNCEHDYVFQSTDYHKNEDSYRCTICGHYT